MDLMIVFGYVVCIGFIILLFYCTRLLSAFFSAVANLMCIGAKPIINTAEAWVDTVNSKLSGKSESGKSFIAHWFGSPLLIIFMIVITGYTGLHYFRQITSLGTKDFILDVITHSSLFYFVELGQLAGTSPNYSASDILTVGVNALLMTAFTDLFISQLFPHRSGWLKQPLSYITVTVYGLIFFAFTSTLGDLISVEPFANLPRDWWNTTWFTLPTFPFFTWGRELGRFAAEFWFRFQWSLNVAVSFGFLFILLVCLFLFLSNILSAFSCGIFSIVFVCLWGIPLNYLFPSTTGYELLFAGILTVGAVLSDVVFQSEPVSQLVESTRPFQFMTNVAETAEEWLTKLFANRPISTLAIIFSGILGGPCLHFALRGIFFFLVDGFSLQMLLISGLLLVAFFVFSIPCLISALKRGCRKKVAILYFVFFVCLAIPYITQNMIQ